MNKSVYTLLVMVLLCAAPLLIAAGQSETIRPEEAYEMIQENQGNEDFVILDVRTPEEYENGHLENAELINFYDDDFEDQVGRLDRDKTYLLYCRTGGRSSGAQEILDDLGFRKVYNMKGGITLWRRKELPIVR
jgi:rhodanese-related sulfurtransferase